jgi:hypothetical protein
VAVLAGLELLVVGLVLGGNEVLSHPASKKEETLGNSLPSLHHMARLRHLWHHC